jgi:hypothetical protein
LVADQWWLIERKRFARIGDWEFGLWNLGFHGKLRQHIRTERQQQCTFQRRLPGRQYCFGQGIERQRQL